jgi:branched-chain amino acid transport system ATP-binding protein
LAANGGLLITSHVTKRFGGLVAVNDVSITFQPGRIHGVIGPNGAGKTTLFNVVSGVMTPSAGSIIFRGREITGYPPHRIAAMGLARSFQTPRVFPSLTVQENVALAAERTGSDGVKCERVLESAWLYERRHVRASELSHGEKKRLDVAQAVAQEPELLLLDEPTAGMNANETRDIARLVRSLADGHTVVVIEHDIDFVKQLADFVTVLDRGRILFEGTVSEVIANKEVRDRYLGERFDLT